MRYVRSVVRSPLGPAMRQRITIALAIGIISAVICYSYLITHPNSQAADFSWPWQGARTLLAGQNPYDDPRQPVDAPLFYPLPTVLLVLPFAPLPPELAGALFFGLSAGLLAYSLTHNRLDPLILFLSAPFWFALIAVQWSPLIVACALLPRLRGLLIAKPNLGIALFLARPGRRGLLAGGMLLLISFALLPSWPLGWLHNLALSIAHNKHRIPILQPLGVPLLLAALRWRDARARLLLGLACVPQLLCFYDQLALGLIPSTLRLRLIQIMLGWLAVLLWLWPFDTYPAISAAAPWVIALLYLPALLLVLQPAAGRLPSSTSQAPSSLA